jgi:hypothetical protein
VDRVIVNVDSMRSAQLVNRKQFYVSISRARQDARVYTDDAQALRRAVRRNQRKDVALEMVNPRPTQHLQPERPTQALQQQRSTGISMGRRAPGLPASHALAASPVMSCRLGRG